MALPGLIRRPDTSLGRTYGNAVIENLGGKPIPIPQEQPKTVAPGVPAQAEEIEPGLESSADFQDRALSEEDFTRDITPNFGPRGPGVELMGGYEDYSGFVGKDPEIWNDTFVTKNRELEGAINAGAQAEADIGDAKEKFYSKRMEDESKELAILTDRRNQRQSQIDQQQQQLTEATTRYSNDLADTGKFWKNPGNVLAAFGACLMNLASDDHMIGLKIIQGAINQDYKQRKDLADMHLGELRSNLGSYRQIAGDKDLGDRLGYAESHRIAAMELERIASQFQGPIAKAKAAAVSKELLRSYQIQMMQLHKAGGVHHEPSFQNPLMAKELKAQGAANPGIGPTPMKGDSWGSTQGGPGGSASGQSAATPAGAQAAGQAGTLNTSMRNALGGKPTTIDKATSELKRYEARAPGTSALVDTYRNRIAHDSMVEAGPYATKAHLDQVAQKIIAKDQEDAGKVAKEAQQYVGGIKGYGMFEADMKRTEAAVARMNATNGTQVTMDEFLGSMRDVSGSWASSIQNLRQKYGSRKTPEDQQAMAELDAAERFHHVMADKVVDYYHSKFGGAMSEGELALGKGVISGNSSWAQIKDFATNGSRQSGVAWNGLLSQAGPRAGTYLQIRYGQGSPKANSPGAKKTGSTSKVGK